MNSFTFSAEMLTGHGAIDLDHRKWISLINAVLDTLETQQPTTYTSELLEVLLVYTRSHFMREELEMRRVNDANLEQHQSDHAAFLRFLMQLRHQLDTAEALDTATLFNFFDGWLRQHLLHGDKQLAEALHADRLRAL